MWAKMEREKGRMEGVQGLGVWGRFWGHFHSFDIIHIDILCRVVAPGSVFGPLLVAVMQSRFPNGNFYELRDA